MNGRCPQCQETVTVGGRHGSRIAGHQCPTCRVPLVGSAAGRSRGVYLCPITGYVTTLGLTGVQLADPMTLTFHPGRDPLSTYREDDAVRTEPTDAERGQLDRVGGRILGPGCVVAEDFGPHRPGDDGGPVHRQQIARAGLRLGPAPDPGDPAAWFVNEPLTYRCCKSCGARVVDQPERRVPVPWVPRRDRAPRGGRRSKPTRQGPHPADSVACRQCDPRQSESEA